MSLFGILIVGGIFSAILLMVLIGVIFDRLDRHKQEDLRVKREQAQRRKARVVSIEYKIDWAETIVKRSSTKYDADTFYLMVEWIDPETQDIVTGPTMVMPIPCHFRPGDEVFIYVHLALDQDWLDTSDPRPLHRHGGMGMRLESERCVGVRQENREIVHSRKMMGMVTAQRRDYSLSHRHFSSTSHVA